MDYSWNHGGGEQRHFDARQEVENAHLQLMEPNALDDANIEIQIVQLVHQLFIFFEKV